MSSCWQSEWFPWINEKKGFDDEGRADCSSPIASTSSFVQMTNRTSSSYKLNNQIVLPEHPEEIYQPTEEEIHEYALYIGIDPEKVRIFSFFVDLGVRSLPCLVRAGRWSSLVSPRRYYESVASWLETLSRRTRRVVLFQFRYGQIVVGTSIRSCL